MIQQNITVGGLSWDDHRAKSQQGDFSLQSSTFVVSGPLLERAAHPVNSWHTGRPFRSRASLSTATQPVDAVLLRKTIEAQDEAFALSSLACLRRESKTKQLASQVDSRIQAVLASGQEKSKLLDSQRARRESRRRIVHAGEYDRFEALLVSPLCSRQGMRTLLELTLERPGLSALIDVPSKPQVEADLRQVEELLQATADLLQQQLARARRAEDVADQVRSLST